MKRISWLLLAFVVACGGTDSGSLFESSGTGAGGRASGAGGDPATSSTTTNSTTAAMTTGAAGGGSPGGSSGVGGSVGTAGTSSAGAGPGAGGGATDASTGRDVSGSGGASGDASVMKDAVAIDGRPGACDAGTFPTFDKGCTDTPNCVIGLHQIDCCGTLVAIGFNHAFRDAFDQAEAAWRQACPALCGCVAGPTRAEDGKVGSSQNVRVQCDSIGNGMRACTTSFP
jgi:hypothetical protein